MPTGAAEFYGDTVVADFEIRDGRLAAVLTDQGRMACESALVCANIWTPPLARKAGLVVPLMPVEHLYAITTPVAELAGETRPIVHPILRDQDRAVYYRQHADCYGIGSYQHDPLLVEPETLGRAAMRPFTPEHFDGSWRAAVELLPALAGARPDTRFNGMFSFSVDGYPILGPAPEVGGLWVAAGVWVTHAGGVGEAIARWMAEGDPGVNVREADIARFHPHAASRSYIRARCWAQYDEVYDIIHPQQPIGNPRGVRLSPFHPRLAALGAHFTEGAGWERPQWFEANAPLLARVAARCPSAAAGQPGTGPASRAPNTWPYASARACSTSVPSPRSRSAGRARWAYLERLAANRIDRPVGKVTYTALLTPRGGIRADLTITRVGRERFRVLTGAGAGMLDLAWLRQHAPADGSVQIADVTSAYAGLGLWGPDARRVLAAACEEDVSDAAFPYFAAREPDHRRCARVGAAGLLRR